VKQDNVQANWESVQCRLFKKIKCDNNVCASAVSALSAAPQIHQRLWFTCD